MLQRALYADCDMLLHEIVMVLEISKIDIK